MKNKSFAERSNETPKITATREGDAIVIRIEATRVEATDELVTFPFGLERAAASRAMRDGHLVGARIGRRLYARRSDVLALVGKLAVSSVSRTGEAVDDYDLLVAQQRGRK